MLTLAEWILFAATGRVLIYLWMQFPEPQFMKLPYWLEKLHRCDLCSGFYIYSILAIALNIDLFGVENIITQIATGAITTFLIHVFVIGWKDKFQPPVIV